MYLCKVRGWEIGAILGRVNAMGVQWEKILYESSQEKGMR
jgi:hypothetical protein